MCPRSGVDRCWRGSTSAARSRVNARAATRASGPGIDAASTALPCDDNSEQLKRNDRGLRALALQRGRTLCQWSARTAQRLSGHIRSDGEHGARGDSLAGAATPTPRATATRSSEASKPWMARRRAQRVQDAKDTPRRERGTTAGAGRHRRPFDIARITRARGFRAAGRRAPRLHRQDACA
jgi:hypothetical protein